MKSAFTLLAARAPLGLAGISCYRKIIEFHVSFERYLSCTLGKFTIQSCLAAPLHWQRTLTVQLGYFTDNIEARIDVFVYYNMKGASL